MRIFRPRPSRSRLSPFFEKYTDLTKQGVIQSQSIQSGYIPPPLKLSHLTGKKILFKYRDLALPSSYDLRQEEKLTPIKDQGFAGTCWAFAAFGSLESCLLPEETWDFSENNMKNLMSQACPQGYDRSFNGGGNEWMATGYLARWSGPVLEKDDPYDLEQVNCKQFKTRKHIGKITYIPDRQGFTDNTNLKLAIKNYGAVFSSMYFDDGYYNQENASYYASGGEIPNHCICLVGWDDNYAKSKFKGTPPGNGAFIVRNSWGKEWGDKGYFYISYYDIWIGRSNAVFYQAVNPANTDIIHQYDSLGWVSSFGFDNKTAWFANIFKCETDQELTGCSFYNASLSSSYHLYIYNEVQPSKPRSGKLVKEAKGSISDASYFIKKFTSPVSLKTGQNFSVVVKLTTPDWNWPIPAQVPIPGYSSKAQSVPGQGFISHNGKSWYDLYNEENNSSVCLKAFAKSK